jgi:hypothetical protein
MFMNTIDDIALLKPGSIIRSGDGRRYRVNSIRKVMPMPDINSEIVDLEKKLNSLQSLLDDATKGADKAVADGDDGEPTIASLQSQVDDIGKSLSDAIAAANKSAAAADTFDRVADDIAKRDGCSRLVALQKARLEAPEQFRRYQMVGIEIAKAARPSGRSNGPSQFELLARTIRQQGKLSGTQALAKARAADPQAFADYQAGK